jgi:endonuclease YncB( thermonuclease family)
MFSLRSCSAAFLLLLATSGSSPAQVLSGPIRVIDADTIDVGAAANVRLTGIDAAEADQTCRDGDRTLRCGAMATAAARRLFEGRTARCVAAARDRYGRYLATCSVDGREINAELVRLGYARTYRDGPTYAREQADAIASGRGLWAYEMQDPATFRARHRAPRAAAYAPAPGTCSIKGNVSRNGRIYHLPGDRSYNRTRIDARRGERWFCSEGAARAAGWRRARD